MAIPYLQHWLARPGCSVLKMFVAEGSLPGYALFLIEMAACDYACYFLVVPDEIVYLSLWSDAFVTLKQPRQYLYRPISSLLPLMQVLVSVNILYKPWRFFKGTNSRKWIFAWAALTAGSAIAFPLCNLLTIMHMHETLKSSVLPEDLDGQVIAFISKVFAEVLKAQIIRWTVFGLVMGPVFAFQLMAILSGHRHPECKRYLKGFRPFVARPIAEYEGKFMIMEASKPSASSGHLHVPSQYFSSPIEKGQLSNAIPRLPIQTHQALNSKSPV
jgi:hypothetical protein